MRYRSTTWPPPSARDLPDRGIADAPSGAMVRAAVPDKLAKYQSMRDFTRTDEPRGRQGGGARDPGESRRAAAAGQRGASFVIQQHAARRMHYDFRLELDGVLLSWS